MPSRLITDNTTVRRSLLRGLFITLLWCFVVLPCAAQSGDDQIVPGRGFQPTGSYALGEIETINTTNGNLMLNIPLGSLPQGRGGSPGFQLTLRYNSKLWDGQPDVAPNPSNPSQSMNVVWLVKSGQGGWSYNTKAYSWFTYNRNSSGVAYSPPACQYFDIWKMKVNFPDGSTREFRPYGIDDHCNDGYFSMQPAPGMSYHSIDGSYARLDIGQTTSEWTLYLADGSRVVHGPTGQRTYDRKGNFFEFQAVPNYNNTGHPAGLIVDQLGRSIAIEKGTNEDYIHVTGVNGEVATTTVKWSFTYVEKVYRAGNHFSYAQPIHDAPIKTVSEIVLPSQLGSDLKYLFDYNGWPTSGNTTPSIGWGELSSVTLPSTARVDYQYDFDNASGPLVLANWILENAPNRKEVNYKLEYDGVVTAATPEVWLYGMSDTAAVITSPDNGVTREWFTDTSNAGGGLVYKSERPDGTVVERIWKENRPYLPPGVTITSLGVNNYVGKEFVSIRDAGGTLVKTAIKEYRHDKNGNLTQQLEYDWVSYSSIARDGAGKPLDTIPADAQLKRQSTTTYYAATPDASNTTTNDPDSYDKTTAPWLRLAASATETGDDSQTLARTEFFYDNAFTTANLTQQKTWDSMKGVYTNPLVGGNSVSVSRQYDGYGNPTLSTDGLGRQTKLTYGSVGGFTGLYPTEVISAFDTPVQRTQTLEYDFSTGLVKKTTDVDNNVSNETDYDVFGRPVETRSAANVPSVKTVTRREYSAVDRRVITRSDLSVAYDGKLVSIVHYDQMGRVRLSRQLEDATTQSATDETTGIKVQTRYTFNAGNSYTINSNPYRAGQSVNAGSETTMGWSRSKSDNGGRVVEVQTFGGAALPAPWGSNSLPTGAVTTSYDAEFVTVADQTLRLRRSKSDGLGRLARVDEPDATSGILGANDNPVQPTSYTYDALNNLRQVDQGQQQRFFMYDSFSRLIRASNPEQKDKTSLAIGDPVTGRQQWSVKYVYDEVGNLTQKTDPRGVVTDYSYDALNRNLSTIYTNDLANTPSITRTYDTAPYGKGLLRSTQTSGATGSITAINEYDALGRAKGLKQTLGSQEYVVDYTYDLAGHVKTINYPSNHTVAYNYDNAGRTLSFTGTLGDNAPRNYATGISYSPFGGISQEQLGTTTPIYNKLFYNSRGQLAEIREGLTPNNDSWQRGAIINFYSTCWGMCFGNSMPDNNGNLKTQEHWIPDASGNPLAVPAQQYEYDQLNRLKRVYEGSPTQPTWQQLYAYDRYGNRRIDLASGLSNPTNLAAVVSNTITNRMYAPGETEQTHPLINYDEAGNQIKDYYSESATGLSYDRSYDAENRTTRSTTTPPAPGSTKISTYTYDGDGKRVRRNVDNVETWQIYGLDGELLVEYAKDAPHTAPQKEYGYRNGQLLITATAATGWGTQPVLHDNPLVIGETTVQARHITELRDAINSLRTHLGLSAFSWLQPPTINVGDGIKADPILEMRTALDQALGAPSPAYSTGLQQGLPIKAIHIQELRDRVLGAWGAGGTDIRWLITDQLGTPRIILDQSGSLGTLTRHDYLPFGENLTAGGRGTNLGYAETDKVRQKFTSKERDTETGLDYFLARYYSSTQGRFTSVDPANAGADCRNPQSWNGYAYAFNSPLKYLDPDGLTVRICTTDGQCTEGDTDLSDADFFRYFLNAPGIKLKNGQIYLDGNVIGTFQRLSFDDLNDYANAVIFGNNKTYGLAARLKPVKTIVEIGAAIDVGIIASVYIGVELAGVGVKTLGLDSLAMRSIQQLNALIKGAQRDLLSKLFGNGVQGAQRALASGRLPAGLTRESLLVYAEIAKRYIAQGRDATGVQALRLEVIEQALRTMK